MIAFYLLAYLLLIAGPIILAWYKGDEILDRISSGNSNRRRRRRLKATRQLPLRGEPLDVLLGVEARRDGIDDRIGETLVAFREVSVSLRTSAMQRSAAASIDEMEQILLARESHFRPYLDLACLQSETVEVLTHEVDLLRKLAEDREGERQATSEDRKGERKASSEDRPSAASDRLYKNLEEARRKRSQVDLRLQGLGAEEGGAPGLNLMGG